MIYDVSAAKALELPESDADGQGPSAASPGGPMIRGRSLAEELQGKASPGLKEIIKALNMDKNATSPGSNHSRAITDTVPTSPMLNPSQLPSKSPQSLASLNQTKSAPNQSMDASDQAELSPGSWYIGYGPSPLSNSLAEASASKDEKRPLIT